MTCATLMVHQELRRSNAGLLGVHGIKVHPHPERLWSHKRIDAKQLITHRFKLDKMLQAYDTLGQAADSEALKVIIEA